MGQSGQSGRSGRAGRGAGYNGVRAPAPFCMILKPFYLNCLAHASYLVGDESSRLAAVIHPQRDIDQDVAFAEARGLRIAHVILTHLHADFVAGHLELRRSFGATIDLGARAEAEYPFEPMADGDSLDLGQVRLTALETPGHTPESISILVFDLAVSADGAGGRVHGRHAVCRRRWAARSARGARLVRGRPREHAVRLATSQAPHAARRDARLPGARRGLALREGAQRRDGVDDRRCSGA